MERIEIIYHTLNMLTENSNNGKTKLWTRKEHPIDLSKSEVLFISISTWFIDMIN